MILWNQFLLFLMKLKEVGSKTFEKIISLVVVLEIVFGR